jgi:hypothetical protein
VWSSQNSFGMLFLMTFMSSSPSLARLTNKINVIQDTNTSIFISLKSYNLAELN